MRYALVSDLHANLQAWNAVLLDVRSLRVDSIVCLGDIVGYGPDPEAVLESVYANVNYFLLGNHDAALCNKIGTDLFNDNARLCIEWTRGRLNARALQFLDRLPLSLVADNFRCVHGDFAQPGQFNYIIEPADALPSWSSVPEPLLFVGHSHHPGLYLLGHSGTPHRIDPEDFTLEADKRFLVNVGSVGQPRDGDARACYCLFDTASGSVYWRRVPFDLDAYRTALGQSGLPESASPFLQHDPRAAAPPLRKMLGFRPPQDPAHAARNVVETGEIKVLSRRMRRWRLVAAILIVLLGLGLIAGAGLWQRHRTRRQVLVSAPAAPLPVETAVPGHNLLATPDRPRPAGSPVPGWTIDIGNRYEQDVETAMMDNGALGFVLHSRDAASQVVFTAPPLTVQPDMKFSIDILCRKSSDFEGSVSAAITLKRIGKNGRMEIVESFVDKTPLDSRPGGGWVRGQDTVTIPKTGREIQFEVRARFRGSLEIKTLSLERRE